MSVYKQIGLWTYVIFLVLAMVAGALSELLLDWAVLAIFVSVLVLGLIVGLLNLSKNVLVQISNISLVLMLVGFLGTNLNTLFVAGPFFAGALKALIAYNLPVVLVSCIARILSMTKDQKEKDERKEPWH